MLSSFFTPCLLSFPHSFRRCYLNFVPFILRQGWGFPLASILYGEWCGLVGLAPFCLVRLGLWAFQGLSLIAFHWFLSSWPIGHFFFPSFLIEPIQDLFLFLEEGHLTMTESFTLPMGQCFLFLVLYRYFFSLLAPACVMLIHFLGLRGMTPLFYFYSLISPSFFLVWYGLFCHWAFMSILSKMGITNFKFIYL